MAITQAVCNSFKTQILTGVHNFSAVSAAATATAAGTGVITVTLAGGASNGLAGQIVVCTGATTAANNGTFLITASNATTITTTNTASSATGPTFATCTLGDTFKIALYTSTATMDQTTTNYVTTNEVVGTGYVAAGNTLVSSTPVLSTNTAICDFVDTSWSTATITARGALIYNSSHVVGASGGAACVVLDFGADKTSTAGTFTITFPVPDSANAIIRIA